MIRADGQVEPGAPQKGYGHREKVVSLFSFHQMYGRKDKAATIIMLSLWCEYKAINLTEYNSTTKSLPRINIY